MLVLARPEARAVFHFVAAAQSARAAAAPADENPVSGWCVRCSATRYRRAPCSGSSSSRLATRCFWSELIRAAAEGRTEERPDTVLAMLQARASGAGSGPRRLVRAASLFGETLWRGGPGGARGRRPNRQRWIGGSQNYQDAEVIEKHSPAAWRNETEYGFRHALMRDAALCPADRW